VQLKVDLVWWTGGAGSALAFIMLGGGTGSFKSLVFGFKLLVFSSAEAEAEATGQLFFWLAVDLVRNALPC
jgi:hypothetical protein